MEQGTTAKTFASWVGPVAERLRENRSQVVAFARSAPAEIWNRPSVVEGWTCKDLLAHIGADNDRLFQAVLRAVVSRAPIDASVFAIDIDGANARGVERRRGWPLERVIEELETSGEEVQELLAGLREEDKELRHKAAPISLGEFIDIVYREDHHLEHLAQLRAALEANA